jgi:hypothetical protein
VVWQHQTLYRRTQSRLLPSEKTVKQVLAPLLIRQLVNVPQNRLIAKIQRSGVDAEEDDYENHRRVA